MTATLRESVDYWRDKAEQMQAIADASLAYKVAKDEYGFAALKFLDVGAIPHLNKTKECRNKDFLMKKMRDAESKWEEALATFNAAEKSENNPTDADDLTIGEELKKLDAAMQEMLLLTRKEIESLTEWLMQGERCSDKTLHLLATLNKGIVDVFKFCDPKEIKKAQRRGFLKRLGF